MEWTGSKRATFAGVYMGIDKEQPPQRRQSVGADAFFQSRSFLLRCIDALLDEVGQLW
jgi:hypothetical protein